MRQPPSIETLIRSLPWLREAEAASPRVQSGGRQRQVSKREAVARLGLLSSRILGRGRNAHRIDTSAHSQKRTSDTNGHHL